MYTLTKKQKEILELNHQGLSQIEIAKRLEITQGSVSFRLTLLEHRGYPINRYWTKYSREISRNCVNCKNFEPVVEQPNNSPNKIGDINNYG